MDIQIEKAVLHILDKNASLPVFSQKYVDLDDDNVYKFISNNIKKMYDDVATKRGEFDSNSIVLSKIKELTDDNFIDVSVKIAEDLYRIIKENEDIESGDMLFAKAKIGEVDILAIIKLNYKEAYTHLADYNDTGVNNRIILHRVIFPLESVTINEGAVISLKDYSIRVTERNYLIDGEKKNYFSDIFLKCKTNLSKKESMKVINAVAKEVNKKYFDEDFEKIAKVKEAIYEEMSETGTVKVEEIAKRTFENNPEIQKEYIEEVQKAGVKPTITFYNEEPEKKFSKHKIKTDNGIELSFPIEIYKNKDMLEFINNPDGTVSILIKNVTKIINK